MTALFSHYRRKFERRLRLYTRMGKVDAGGDRFSLPFNHPHDWHADYTEKERAQHPLVP